MDTATTVSRHTNAMMCLHATLIRGISTLKKQRAVMVGHRHHESPDVIAKQTCSTAKHNDKIYVKIGTGRALRPLYSSYDTMLPLWREFADVLCSLPDQKNGVVHLLISHVQLSKEILDILTPALLKAPIYRLAVMNVGVEKDGIALLTRVIESNPYLCNFSLRKNEISDVQSLIQAVGQHAGIRLCSLDECGIGEQLSTVPDIIPILFESLDAAGLGGNGIESKGAYLISQCLAANPTISFLDLDDNLFNDEDANALALSLKSNTNLVDLSLRGNNLTSVGLDTLYKSIFDDNSLNAISDSNHTCELKLFDDGEPVPFGIDREVLSINAKQFEYEELPELVKVSFMLHGPDLAIKTLQTDGRKKVKMLHALTGGDTNEGIFNMRYINDFPLELLPDVLVFVQEACQLSAKGHRGLNYVFQLIHSRPVG